MPWMALAVIIAVVIISGRSVGRGMLLGGIAAVLLFFLIPIATVYIFIGGPMLVYENEGTFWAVVSGLFFFITPVYVAFFTDYAPVLYKANVFLACVVYFWCGVFALITGEI